MFNCLYAVLKALNLVKLSEGRADAADSHAVTFFWNTSPVGQMRELFNAYPQLDLPVAYNVRPLSEFSYYGGPEKQPDSEIRKVILSILRTSVRCALGFLSFILRFCNQRRIRVSCSIIIFIAVVN